MAFDADRFLSTPLIARTQEVRVPDLRAFFGDADEPVWTVRQLTANEISRADAAKARMGRESALAAALVSGTKGDIVRELQATLGRGDDVEPDMARRIEMLRAGSVDPPCSTELAVRIAEHYPVVFFQLTNAILTLTGQGSDVEKKPKPSGPSPESEPPPASET
jgi:hypothetical protein